MAEFAGGQVQCPNPDCLQPVPIPLPIEETDEPLPESAPPKPRRERRFEEAPRAAILPWALAAVACLVAAVSVAGWVLITVRGKSNRADQIAALEETNRELWAENQMLRGPADAVKPPPKKAETPAVPAREIGYAEFQDLAQAGQLRSVTFLNGWVEERSATQARAGQGTESAGGRFAVATDWAGSEAQPTSGRTRASASGTNWPTLASPSRPASPSFDDTSEKP